MYLNTAFNKMEHLQKQDNFWSTFFKVFFSLLTVVILFCAVTYFIAWSEGNAGPDATKMWEIYNKLGINPMTLTSYERDVMANIIFNEDIEEGFDDIGGNETLKDTVKRLVIKPTLNPEIYTGKKLLKPPNGIILYGPPGTGKSMTARAIAKEVGGAFINVTSDLVENKFYGESQKIVHAIFSLADKLKPCVVFFDEIDGLCGTRNLFDQSHVTSVKTTLLSEMDGVQKRDPGIIAVGATNRIDNLDPALKRRMRLHINVDLPDEEARKSILSKVVSGEPLDEDVKIEDIAGKTDGMSGSDLHELCKLAAQHAIKNSGEETDYVSISKTAFESAIVDLCGCNKEDSEE